MYSQTNATLAEEVSLRTGAPTGDLTATVSVKITGGTNALAGLVLRRASNPNGSPAYFFGVRNSASDYHCGIYEKAGSTWTLRTGLLTTCKVSAGTAVTLLVRALGGRLEMYLNGARIATWVDATPLAAGGFGLMTIYGSAIFDDVKAYGALTRSYYAFGSGRVAERQTTSAKTAGAADVYYLHADHPSLRSGQALGSVSLMTKSNGTQQGDRAYYMPFGDTRGTAASGLPTDFGFTGGRVPVGLGLVHLGARFYDLRVARWVSPDSATRSSETG